MARQVRADTKPEIALRRELHRRGLRFRVHDARLPGRPDVVLVRIRLAIFVDGCFWHSCPDHGVLPRANRQWWTAKLEGNRERDARNERDLRDKGWNVLRVWEHQDPCDVAREVARWWDAARVR